MFVRIPKDEPRTFEQLEEHYLIEKRLAERLRNARKPERRSLYAELYDELFGLVPLHPQLTLKAAARGRSKLTSERMRLLHPLLSRESTFMEVGPGDCALAIELCKEAKKAYVVEVSRTVTAGLNLRSLELLEDLLTPLPRIMRRWILGRECLASISNITLAATKPKGAVIGKAPYHRPGPGQILFCQPLKEGG